MEPWIIWMIAGILCIIIEIMTTGFVFLSFGVAAIVTGLVAKFVNVPIQFLIFALSAFLVFLSMRKFSKKILSSNPTETNMYALKGKTGIVTKTIEAEGKGYVKIGGEEWSAVSIKNEKIESGQKILIKDLEGNKLIVDLLKEE